MFKFLLFEVQRGQQSKKPVHTLEKETEKSLLKKKSDVKTGKDLSSFSKKINNPTK